MDCNLTIFQNPLKKRIQMYRERIFDTNKQMKNWINSFINKFKKEKQKEETKEYYLCCDFGYDITSPIPSVEPLHKNSHCLVAAVVGTTVELFPGDPERFEFVEFVSFIIDENRQINGIKCRIRPDTKILRFLGDPEDLEWEVDLICGKEVFAEYSNYENGKNTHTYRRLLLQVKDPAAKATEHD